MIKIKCEAPHAVQLDQLVPFQGSLKKRGKKDVEALYNSLCEDGLLMPFVVWIDKDKYKLLDGHGRREALIKAAEVDKALLQQQFPCIIVEAATEDEARKALVQIVSIYGRINRAGVVEFVAPISGYKAPIIKAPKSVAAHKMVDDNVMLLRLRVPKDMYGQLSAFLKTLKGVEIY